MSITFGVSVPDGWFSAITNLGANTVYLSQWTRVAGTTDEFIIQEDWASSGIWQCGAFQPQGQYQLQWTPTCEIQFTATSDFLCTSRSSFYELSGDSDSKWYESNAIECGEAGTQVVGRLESGVPTEIVFADGGYVLVTSGSDISLHQWNTLGVEIVITSLYPKSDCMGTGTYNIEWEPISCGLQICGVTDDCNSRASMLHNSQFNAFSGNTCPDWAPAAPSPPPIGNCNTGLQWNEHPYACIDQPVEGGCAFCAGRVSGKDINYCYQRKGAKCNELFNEVVTKNYCNLAFECGPASVVSFSVALFISSLVVLFF